MSDKAGCFSTERLEALSLLDETLTETELAHLASCADCQQALEKLAPRAKEELDPLKLSPTELEKPRDGQFSHEPEFQALQQRLADLEDTRPDSHDHLTAAGSDTRTDVGPVVEDINADSVLRSLQNQLPGGRFKLRRVLGRGAGGIVTLAFDNQAACDVAIKFFSSRHPDAHRRFQREADVLLRLTHDNVVRLFEVGQCHHSEAEPEGDVPSNYLVMEYLSGGSAQTLTSRVSPNNFRRYCEMLVGAAEGLQAAHELGIIHRDIKPANLLYDVDFGRFKVADFGLVTSLHPQETTLTQSGDFLGTPVFMSPEHVVVSEQTDGSDGGRLDVRSDVYSFGATMYAMFTGQPPVRGTLAAVIHQILHEDVARPTIYCPKLPEPIEAICLKCLEKNPSDRYGSMKEVAADLRNYLSGRPTVARRPGALGQLRRWAQRNKSAAWSAFGISSLVLILLAGSLVASTILWKQQQELVEERQRRVQQMCEQVAVSDPAALSVVVSQLNDRETVLPFLERLRENATERRAIANTAIALQHAGANKVDELIGLIKEHGTDAGHCQVLFDGVRGESREAIQSIERCLADPELDDTARVKLSILAYRLGEPAPMRSSLLHDSDMQTMLIHMLPEWHGNVRQLVDETSHEIDPDILFALWSAIGLTPPDAFDTGLHQQLVALTSSQANIVADEGVVSAIQWTQRQLGIINNRKEFDETSAPFWSQPEELANPEYPGFRMIRVAAGEFDMGGNEGNEFTDRVQHPVEITRDFLIADREVSRALFAAFTRLTQTEEANGDWVPDEGISPTEWHPAQRVSWFSAVKFCNWLSRQHKLQPCYSLAPEELKLETYYDGESADEAWTGENWRFDPQANGYRLPTEAEFEFACRAGSTTLYSFGNSMTYFEDYVAWSNNTRVPTVIPGNLMPNRFGLFDMHGNVWEWAQDWYEPYESDQRVVDPMGKKPSLDGRSFRGGGVCTYTGYPDSSSRGHDMAYVTYFNLGFRVARNLD